MRKLIVASLAMGVTLAFIPSALADSFGYETSGSMATVSSSFAVGSVGFSSGVVGSGATALAGMPGTFGANRETAAAFDSPSMFAFNNGTQANGVLVDLSGYELNFFSGGFGGGASSSNSASRRNHLADKGAYQIGNMISKGSSDPVGATATLAATPEPASLFLLGTGLLGLALVLFRKSAKTPAESSTNN